MINKKESDVSVDILTSFNDVLAVCSLEHLKTCMCQPRLLRKLYSKSYKHHVDDVIVKCKEKKLTDDEIERVKETGIDRAKKESFIETAKFCVAHNIRCPIEKQEIIKTIKIFDHKYDLNDPRVYFVVKAVLNHQLSAYRMQKYSNKYGIVQEQYDREGNRSYILNPVEESKRKFDETMVKAIATLNNMIEGQKVTNLNYEVVDADELFGDTDKKEIAVDYRVIEQ